jgi:hypothetical protein
MKDSFATGFQKRAKTIFAKAGLPPPGAPPGRIISAAYRPAFNIYPLTLIIYLQLTFII